MTLDVMCGRAHACSRGLVLPKGSRAFLRVILDLWKHKDLEPDLQSPGLRYQSLHNQHIYMFQSHFAREILFPEPVHSSSSIPGIHEAEHQQHIPTPSSCCHAWEPYVTPCATPSVIPAVQSSALCAAPDPSTLAWGCCAVCELLNTLAQGNTSRLCCMLLQALWCASGQLRDGFGCLKIQPPCFWKALSLCVFRNTLKVCPQGYFQRKGK